MSILLKQKDQHIVGLSINLFHSEIFFWVIMNFYKNFSKFFNSFKNCFWQKFVKIFFNHTVKIAVENYVNDSPIEDLNGYLFKSRKGDNPITERGLWKIIVDVADDAGIEKNVGSHSLRKTWARNIYDNAEDKSGALVMLQECLRHSDSLTTLRYISIMDEEKKDMYESIELGLDYI